MSYKLTEIAVGLIQSHIKANISAALSDVRTERVDAKVSTEIPQSYFIYAGAKGYRTPAVFIICDSMDFRLPTGPNFINGMHDIKVSVLIEDRIRDALVVKAWRYQAALTKLLNQTQLISNDTLVKIVCKVVRNAFSPLFSETTNESHPQSVFRKEVVVELEVEHYEQI